MKTFILFLSVLFPFITVTAQSPVDSLLLLCEKATEKEKAGYFLEMSFYLRDDTAKSNSLTRKAYQFALKNDQKALQAKSYYYLAESYYFSNDYTKAIPLYQMAIPIFNEVNDSYNVCNCINSIGLCYYFMYQGEKAIAQFIEGLKSCESDKKFTGQFFSNIAMTHALMNNKYDAAINYWKALSINTSIHDSAGMAVNYNGLGSLYTDSKQPDSAIVNLTKALHIFKKKKRIDRQAIALSNLATIYPYYPDSLNKAIAYFDQALKIFNTCGMDLYKAEVTQGMASIFYKQGKYKAAIDAYNESLHLNDLFNRGILLKKTNYQGLSEVYEKTGDYKAALKYHKLYVQIADSLDQQEKYDKIVNLEKQYETKKKENEILQLKAKQDLTNIELRKNKQLKLLGFVTALLLLILAGIILKKYNDKLKSNRLLEDKNRQIEQSENELRQMNASKNKFFSIIAHDLLNPLHILNGNSDLLSRNYDIFTEKERRKFAADINSSSINIYRLLQNLLEWSKSQTGRLNYSPIKIKFSKILENALSALRASAEQKKIQLDVISNDDLMIFVDPKMIETVLRNLVTNAIKFTPENGHIKITTELIENHAQINIIDNGVGISEKDVQNLFKIDSKVKRKGTNDEDGSGLGLILCKEFIDKNNGSLWVESTPSNGSTFSFTIPLENQV